MNVRRMVVVITSALVMASASLAQQRVDPANRYERLIAIVPLTGKGTHTDPKRPMYAPAPHEINPTLRTGLLGFKYVMSDDGHFALVEFTARTRTALLPILNDKSIKSFLKGRDKPQDVQNALKQFKKDFDWSKFVERMQ